MIANRMAEPSTSQPDAVMSHLSSCWFCVSQNSESWTEAPFDGVQECGSSGVSGPSIGREVCDSSETEAPGADVTLVNARHYAESEPMPSTPAPMKGESSPSAMDRAVQLKLF